MICSPSVSENSTQVRPCQASMHSTKSLPPSHPQQALSRQPGPPAPQGSRGACSGGHRAQEVQGAAPTWKPRILHSVGEGSHLPHSEPQMLFVLLCSHLVYSHWHPELTRKNLLALRASPFLEGLVVTQSPPIPKEQLPFSYLFASLVI